MIMYLNILISCLYLIIIVLYYTCILVQRQGLCAFARRFVLLPFCLQIAVIIVQGFLKGRILLSSVSEVLFILSFLIVLIYILIDLKLNKGILGLFILPVIFLLHSISFVTVSETRLDTTVFSYPVFNFHTMTTVAGYAALIIAVILSTIYLYLIYKLKKRQFGQVFYNSPSLEMLDCLVFIFQLTGIIFLIVGVISGFRLTMILWGNFPFSDPKIIFTFFLLFYYCAGILFRYIRKPGAWKINIHSVLGFVIIIFLFFIVNILFVSRHDWG